MFRQVGVLVSLLCISLTALGESVFFEHQGNRLSAQFLKPEKGLPTRAVLILVHGDGAMKHDADGYYTIFAEPLREKGFAVFSWDKPGVGDSTGNWLSQSMVDRQSEVRAAVKFLQQKYGFQSSDIGLLGFSQAGWVVPALLGEETEVGFSVGIGFARNWLQQGRYLTRTRLELEGKSDDVIASELKQSAKGVAFLRQNPTYAEYLEFAGEDAMAADRYEFVLKNFTVDASEDYAEISVPSLFMWGEGDLNVDAVEENAWWQAHPNPMVTTTLIANASHGMLKADKFDTQTFSVSQWFKLMWLEQDAFAEDFMPALLSWLESTVPQKADG